MTPGWQCCSCEPTCQLYGECCVDYLWQRYNGSFSSMKEYKDFLINETRARRNTDFECYHAADPFISKQYWMVTKCPSHTKEEREGESCWRSKYHYVEESLVVLGDDGILYTNAYCASCNGVQSYQIVQFITECILEKTILSSCFISLNLTRSAWIHKPYRQEQRWPLKQCESFKKRCTEEDGKTHELCSAFQGPVAENRNPFCLDCQKRHYFARTNTKEDYLCKNWNWNKRQAPIKFSYTTSLKYEDRVTSKTCEEARGTIFGDILYGVCSTISCQLGYKSFNSICYQFETFYSNELEINSFDEDLVPTLKYLTIYDKNITNKNLTNFTSYLGEMLSIKPYDANTVEIELNFFSNETLNNLTEYIVTDRSILTDNISYVISPHSLILDTLLFNVTQVFPDGRLCAELKPLSNDSISSERKYELEYKNFTYWIALRKGYMGKYVRECKWYFPVCQFRVLEANTTLIDSENLIYMKNGLSMNKKYISVYGGFVICEDEDEEPRPWYFFIIFLKNYPLLIGLVCLCFLVLVTSYGVMRALRSSRRMHLFSNSVFRFQNESNGRFT